MKLLKSITIFLLFIFLLSCSLQNQSESTATKISTNIDGETRKTPQPDTTLVPSPTPTERVFATLDDCEVHAGVGQITYVQGDDLYIMSGDGCFNKLVMEGVSRSPVWSSDGQMIAVVVNSKGVIIVDVTNTLDSCVIESNRQICQTEISGVFEICSDKSCHIDRVSWGADLNRIAVAYNDHSLEELLYRVCLLSLEDGDCQDIYESEYQLWVDWSTTDDSLAVSEITGKIVLLGLDGDNHKYLTQGLNPAWSPDGKRIAFLKPSEDETKESYGIASINADGSGLKWLYFPANRDYHYLWPQNLGFGLYPLSWSPDQRYIALSPSFYHMEYHDVNVMRLDIQTGEIVLLTKSNQAAVSQPDWGP